MPLGDPHWHASVGHGSGRAAVLPGQIAVDYGSGGAVALPGKLAVDCGSCRAAARPQGHSAAHEHACMLGAKTAIMSIMKHNSFCLTDAVSH